MWSFFIGNRFILLKESVEDGFVHNRSLASSAIGILPKSDQIPRAIPSPPIPFLWSHVFSKTDRLFSESFSGTPG